MAGFTVELREEEKKLAYTCPGCNSKRGVRVASLRRANAGCGTLATTCSCGKGVPIKQLRQIYTMMMLEKLVFLGDDAV